MISPPLIEAILGQYWLALHGIHGPTHWGRVLENGRRLAFFTGANQKVVALFAVFHDACRRSEDHDPHHGSRGADLSGLFRGNLFELNDDEFSMLKVACRLHTEGLTEGNVTVQTCWDADRLDLGRIGVKPRPKLLCTSAAKDLSNLAWAHDRAAAGYVPCFVAQDWLKLPGKSR